MNVLVIAPHPDDEAIGCGGSIAKHVAQGDRVKVLFLTNGERGMEGWLPQATDYERAKIRHQEAKAAQQVLGYQFLAREGIRDGNVLNARHLSQETYDWLASNNWDRIYCPHPDDAHTDHFGAWRIIHDWVCSKKREIAPNQLLWLYECWTPLSRPDPAKLTDITPWLGHKYGAIRCYKSQEHNSFCSAILALNHYRGLLLGPNKMYCEAFG